MMPEAVELSQLFENAPGYMAVLRGPDHRFEVANAAYRKLVGDRDLIGKPVREALPELTGQGYIRLLDQVYSTGEPYRADNIPVVLNGEGAQKRFFISFIYQPIRDERGQVSGIFAEGIDVTPPMEAEEARRQAEAHLDAFFSQTAVGMSETTASGRFVRVNDRFCEITGRARAELLTLSMQDITHPEDLPKNLPLFNRSASGGGSFEIEKRYVRPDGSLVWVHNSVTTIRDPATGDPSSTICVTIDVSERKQAEAELRQSRDQLAEEREALDLLNRTGSRVAAELDLDILVQEVVDAGVSLTGAAFGAFFYNVEREGGERFLLYSLSGAEKADFENFGMPRATKVFAPTFLNEGIVRVADITRDARYGHNAPHRGMPQGHLPVRSYLAVPVVARSGEVIGGLIFGHPEPDVFDGRSERLMVGLAAQAAIAIDNARLYDASRRANELLESRVRERTLDLEVAHEALRQAQKMEAIGQLTGGIAHDFNNLLTVIRGSADLLRTRDLPEEKRRRYVDAISDTADRAAKLTGQLLAFARRQALKPEVFDAGARVHAIAEMLRTVLGSRIQLKIDTSCHDCFIEADPAQFETALVNLAVNARDAMEGEGELSVTVERAGDSASHQVAVTVSDNGHGIEADKLDRIFEPFFTTKEVGKGTGLGLSQVYGFAKQSGGEVRVESEFGKGASFTLVLPWAEASTSADPESQALRRSIGGRGRVLVVEDNPHVGEFASELLSDLGFQTTFAADAQQALEQLERDPEAFDVVLTDVVMPGMNGVELAKLVRRRWERLPVVLTSGYSHVLAEEQKHGFPLLHKPYSVETVTKVLREALA